MEDQIENLCQQPVKNYTLDYISNLYSYCLQLMHVNYKREHIDLILFLIQKYIVILTCTKLINNECIQIFELLIKNQHDLTEQQLQTTK